MVCSTKNQDPKSFNYSSTRVYFVLLPIVERREETRFRRIFFRSLTEDLIRKLLRRDIAVMFARKQCKKTSVHVK